MSHGYSKGIPLKKRYGQHFLRDHTITHSIVSNVDLTDESSVFEIGCGDGFLTREILKQKLARLWIFEIDEEWVEHIRSSIDDPRVEVYLENILDVDFDRFDEHKPWTLLANLPYQITFPILHMLQRNRHRLKEGVIMMQEEVAQKIMKTSGRGYGFPSLFFQRYFELRLLDKVSPEAFYPPPKVFSRLMYFKPRAVVEPIEREDDFWKFVKICLRQPRRTLRNNLAQAHYDTSTMSDELLALRAQQMKMDGFLQLWDKVRK